MLALIGCIIASVAVGVCFKVFALRNINTFNAIVANYWCCVIFGSLIHGHVPALSYGGHVAWVPYAWLLGAVFVSGFNFAALSVRHTGIAITTAMQKMSLIMSAGFAILVFGEVAGWSRITGIAMAVLAIGIISYTRGARITVAKPSPALFFPLATLFFSGLIEIVLYFVNARGLTFDGNGVFTTYAFTVAAIIGSVVVTSQVLTGRRVIRRQDIAGGVALGIPNFFSIYLILVLLQQGFDGSVVFPILNVLILVFSVLTGMLLFSERLSLLKIMGIAFAVISILLIAADS